MHLNIYASIYRHMLFNMRDTNICLIFRDVNKIESAYRICILWVFINKFRLILYEIGGKAISPTTGRSLYMF